jgi:hypothetical protein
MRFLKFFCIKATSASTVYFSTLEKDRKNKLAPQIAANLFQLVRWLFVKHREHSKEEPAEIGRLN